MNLLFILFISSFIFSQNFIYNDEDWMIVSNPGKINSMTIRYDEILFTSENGIYSYNQNSQSLNFIPEFIRGFSKGKNKIIHYDLFRDHLWFINNDKIFFKPYISSIWREIEFYDLNILDATDIINIGFNSDYIFIKTAQGIIILNPYTGDKIAYDEHLIDDSNLDDIQIIWSSTYYDDNYLQIDFKKFISFEGYNIISNDYIEYKSSFIRITSYIKDNNNNLWIGTDTGELFKCDLYLNTIEKINNIPYSSNINNAYYDQYGEWWISINDDIQLYNDSFVINEDLFLLHWKEDLNKWSYLENNFNFNINSSDITSIYRKMNNLYVGTKRGLFKYAINKDEWTNLKSIKREKNDYYIYNIKQINNLIYVATNTGLKIFSVINDNEIKKNIFSIFDNYLIKDLAAIDNRLYIASEIGLFEYSVKDNNIIRINDISYSGIISDGKNNLYAFKKNRLLKINNEGISYLSNIKNIKNMCFCNEFIWFNNSRYATIFNLLNNEVYEYDELDGLLSKKIHSIQCDEEWVWFSTDRGIILYNWSKYHNNE